MDVNFLHEFGFIDFIFLKQVCSVESIILFMYLYINNDIGKFKLESFSSRKPRGLSLRNGVFPQSILCLHFQP